MVLAYILIVSLAAFCLYLLSRVGDLEVRIEAAFAELKQLRQSGPAPLTAPVEQAVEQTVEEPLKQAVEESLEPEPVSVPAAIYVPRLAPPPLPVAQGPTLSERLRAVLGDDEWETIVGGSLLNKAGALILVIGIALFLGFSFGRITPAGRAGVALAVSAGVLAGGIWLERKQRYQVFARGLIGAGWAALYATAYAAYAIPAARVIDDPFVGSLGILAVAAGMIGHSLRYRAQAVTGIAYFPAFAALASTPSSPFAVVSLVPLAVSLLCLAARFDWYSMALFGMAATYLTCISRGTSGAPLAETQALLLVYWLMFEAFDLLRTRRDVAAGGVEWIYPGNLTGFIGLSWLAWANHQPANLWLAASGGSALFLADSIARAFLRPIDEPLATGLRFGGYQSSAFISAVLGGLAIVARVQGVWMSAALAVEAEILYLLGIRLNAPFLRRMGITAFAHSLFQVFWEQPLAKSNALGHPIWNQSPPAVLHAVIFWLNRYLRRPNPLMSWAAAVLLAGVIAAEAPQAWIGPSLAVFGTILLEIGLRRDQSEFRLQGYALLTTASVVAFLPVTSAPGVAIALAAVYGCALRSSRIQIFERDNLVWGSSALSVAVAGLLLWRVVPIAYVGLAWAALALLVLELGIRQLPSALRAFFVPAGVFAAFGLALTHANDFAKFPAASVSVSFFGTAVIAWASAYRNRANAEPRDGSIGVGVIAAIAGVWLVVPDPFVSVLWTVLGLAVLEVGADTRVETIRLIALVPLAFVYARIFLYDLDRAPLRATPVAIAGLYRAWYRLRGELLAKFLFWLAIVPPVVLIFDKAGSRNAPAGWMAISLILLLAGTRFGVPHAEMQSWIIAGVAFGWAVFVSRWQIALATVAGLYIGQFLARRSPESRARIGFSVAGTLLLAAVLYRQISGSLLTVSLGLEGLASLGFGFALRERICRLQGLALLLFCILKLFVYDLRNLETMYRILSFVALGLILLGVSWIYTRFREHVKKLL